jgi:hypothetical protein
MNRNQRRNGLIPSQSPQFERKMISTLQVEPRNPMIGKAVHSRHPCVCTICVGEVIPDRPYPNPNPEINPRGLTVTKPQSQTRNWMWIESRGLRTVIYLVIQAGLTLYNQRKPSHLLFQADLVLCDDRGTLPCLRDPSTRQLNTKFH